MHARSAFEVQGHRGARGLLPENTLPSFELALDLGVSSIETDVFLTADDAIVVFHDPEITERVCTGPLAADLPAVATKPLVRSLTLQQVRGYRIDCGMKLTDMPLATRFAQRRGIEPYGIPTLPELFEFVDAYASSEGADAGKTPYQQTCARRLIFDIELKRVPFRPETVDDGFTGAGPGNLERRVVEAIYHAGVPDRTRIRSFDHRSVRAVKQLEPALETGVLTYHTVPADIGLMLASTGAEVYCPDFHFVDAEVVRQVHAVGKRILPYTVNQPDEWERLLAWKVAGVTTDFPDRLLEFIRARHISEPEA